MSSRFRSLSSPYMRFIVVQSFRIRESSARITRCFIVLLASATSVTSLDRSALYPSTRVRVSRNRSMSYGKSAVHSTLPRPSALVMS